MNGEVTFKTLFSFCWAVALGCALVWAVLNFERVAGWADKLLNWTQNGR